LRRVAASGFPMKKIGASLMLAVALSSPAFAQTNTAASREMSLQDCFAAALQNNFDVRIQQFNPEIQGFTLRQDYSDYDPTLKLKGEHDYSDQGVSVQTNRVVLPTISRGNTFTPDITGGTPWGMSYDLGNSGDLSKTYIQKDAGGFYTNFTSSSGSFGLKLTQPLLKNFWIDDTRLQILVDKNRLKYTEQGLRNQIITTITAVENAYYELIYARENMKVQQEALVLAQTQLEQDQQRVKIGTIAEAGGTLEQDQAQVAQSRANLIAAQYTLASDENALKNLVTDSFARIHDQTIEPTEKLDAVRQLFDVQDSWSKGMAERPDLQQSKLDLEQQGIQLKYFRNQLFPQLDVFASYGFNGEGNTYEDSFSQIRDGSRPYYSYGGQITIPLGNVKARNQLKAGKATEKQLLLKLKQLEQNIMVDIDNAVKQSQSAWESVDATRQARTYAETALDAEQKKYTVGKSTTFTVLQLQNNLTSARSQEIRALANYNEALANLAAAEGSTLQRRNLEIKLK
jgi:outer membrane protein TolC